LAWLHDTRVVQLAMLWSDLFLKVSAMSESIPLNPRSISIPALLITGTDTGVGKTFVTAAIARHLQQTGKRVGVFKPMVSGCQRDAEGNLVGEDTWLLKEASGTPQTLEQISPVRFEPPLAPAAAAELTGVSIDWQAIDRALSHAQQDTDILLIEGVGGLLVPLAPEQPNWTVLSLAECWNIPTVIVSRAGLGTLNHSAMTAALLAQAKVPVAGVVLNQADATEPRDDPSVASNADWITRITDQAVLATVGHGLVGGAADQSAVPESIANVDWCALAKPSRP
jgi:dethiobiotin synthetase